MIFIIIFQSSEFWGWRIWAIAMAVQAMVGAPHMAIHQEYPEKHPASYLKDPQDKSAFQRNGPNKLDDFGSTKNPQKVSWPVSWLWAVSCGGFSHGPMVIHGDSPSLGIPKRCSVGFYQVFPGNSSQFFAAKYTEDFQGFIRFSAFFLGGCYTAWRLSIGWPLGCSFTTGKW